MLRELSIQNVLLIESLDLTFQPGLNVLTGETGAGKSILLDALGMVLGWRGRADVVRSGADAGEVSAVFDLSDDHPARAVLMEAGLPVDEELVLRRINTRDGRKRGFVNDRRVSSEVLRALSATLVELHGQHDDKGLLDPKEHRILLDGFGQHAALQDKVRLAWRDWQDARKKLEKERATLAETERDAEFLRHAAKELGDMDVQLGEDEELDTSRRLMQGAEKIREEISSAEKTMGLDGAEGRLGDALRWLEMVAEKTDNALDAPIDALMRSLNELAEAQSGVAQLVVSMQFDPHELEITEERLFALRALARKHNVQPDELPALAVDFAQQVQRIDAGSATLGDLENIVSAAAVTFQKHAEKLNRARVSAAKDLDKAMAGELAPLKMERAVFTTEVTPSPPGPEGIDAVVFTVATNPGAPAGAINKIASGGELSRFLLALKVCLTRHNNGLTMIFDEIDRGVGGATANAVGRRLAQVAEKSQVLVVTHSPQVAALGAHHWQVRKSIIGTQTRTDVTPLDEAARIDELARMLAGDTVTDEARSAARALLAG